MSRLVIRFGEKTKKLSFYDDRGRKKRPIVLGVARGNGFFVLGIRKNG